MKKRLRKPYRFRTKKASLSTSRILLIISLLLIVAGLSYLFFFSDIFKIKKLEINGNQKISSEEIEALINNSISKSIFLIKTKTIKESLLSNFVLIDKAKVKKIFPDSLEIIVQEKLPVANWIQNDRVFLLDNKGIIFEESEMGRLLKLSGFTLSLDLGSIVINPKELTIILDIKSRIDALNIPLERINIISSDRLDIQVEQGWEIYLDPQKDIPWQITKLSSVLEKEIPPEYRKNLQYIELRFGNSVPFRYKD